MSTFNISREDQTMLRNYVTAQDHLQYSTLPEGMVAVTITHCNLPQKLLDLRFDLHNSIGDVKEKLRKHIGTPAQHQRLILRSEGRDICEMSDDTRMLGFYSVESGMEIYIIDTDPFSLSRGGGLTDVSLVDKYKMSDEAYDKRKGTLREWIKAKKQADPTWKMTPISVPKGSAADPGSNGTNSEPPPGPESVVGIEVGLRCQVSPGSRRGVVRYVGEVPEMKAGGFWVGIVFDEPVGLGDGTKKGVTYFECPSNYGSFVRVR